jgi:hypothetical protein
MAYKYRLLVLVAASTLFTPLYFMLLPRVMPKVPLPIGFLLPSVVIIVVGSIFLVGGRRTPDGKTVGYARIVLMAVLTAVLSPFLTFILMGLALGATFRSH